jgi:hypothetical protein
MRKIFFLPYSKTTLLYQCHKWVSYHRPYWQATHQCQYQLCQKHCIFVLPKLNLFLDKVGHLCLIIPNSVQKFFPFGHVFIHFGKEIVKSLLIILLLFH